MSLCWTNKSISCLDSHGYNITKMQGRNYKVHKLSYEVKYGVVRNGLELDHLCRNRACYNPDHLEAVTHKENVRRGYNYQRDKTHCKQGHEFTHDNTYIRTDGGKRRCKTCQIESSRRYRDKRNAC